MLDQTSLLHARAEDLAGRAVSNGIAYSRFLSEQELLLTQKTAEKYKLLFTIFGGYDDAERCMIGLSAFEKPDDTWFPIKTLYFKMDRYTHPSHRDVLGALMALGIKRELIGDILLFDDICCFFVCDGIADYIADNLMSVGAASVSVGEYAERICYRREYNESMVTVSSLRLDCVIAEIAHCSRNEASRLISEGLVFVGGVQSSKKDRPVECGATLAIRGYGKWRIGELVGTTKKDRIKLKILKYI